MKISSKYLNLDSLINLSSQILSNDENPRFLFHTGYGFVSGSIMEPVSDSTDINEYLKDMLKHPGQPDLNIIDLLKRIALEKNDYELIGDGSYLILKDVKVYHQDLGHPVYSTKVMLVHVDHVIGATLVPSGSGY